MSEFTADQSDLISMQGDSDAINGILELTPESWDNGNSGCSIAVAYVTHLRSEVERLGGCLRSWCWWIDNEPCDHGYLAEPIEHGVAP